jgi:hypothetical protein
MFWFSNKYFCQPVATHINGTRTLGYPKKNPKCPRCKVKVDITWNENSMDWKEVEEVMLTSGALISVENVLSVQRAM